jgi:hypothetical protein
MPPSIHKILIHGSRAIELAPFPIGMLSEEAQERRNKDYIRFRRNHRRKTSRIESNTDLMHMLLISSEPVITSKSNVNVKTKQKKAMSRGIEFIK